MNIKKSLLELYGLILGDGTFYLDRGKYPHMIFFNFNLKLINKAKKIIEILSEKKINISYRKRKTGIEYSICIPISITKKLLDLGFNKKSIPKNVINNKNAIFLLKGLFEADGSYNGSRIYIYQKNAERILLDCQKIANKFGLSAHIHDSSKKRHGEKFLAIENTLKIKKLFGNTIKKIDIKDLGKGKYYITKREILNKLSDMEWTTTSEIYNYLKTKNIDISNISASLLNKHLNPLWMEGLLFKIPSKINRNEKGQFIRTECKWKLSQKLSKTDITNFPYGVLK